MEDFTNLSCLFRIVFDAKFFWVGFLDNVFHKFKMSTNLYIQQKKMLGSIQCFLLTLFLSMPKTAKTDFLKKFPKLSLKIKFDIHYKPRLF